MIGNNFTVLNYFFTGLEVNYTGFTLSSILCFILAEMPPKLGPICFKLNIPQRRKILKNALKLQVFVQIFLSMSLDSRKSSIKY